jgi:site-specific recombinase XerD
MLRDGATLETVAAVLRHRSINMTAHYAKVDVARLSAIAQPWPGEG